MGALVCKNSYPFFAHPGTHFPDRCRVSACTSACLVKHLIFLCCRCCLLPLFSVPNQAIVGREVNQSSSKCIAPHRTGTRRADENGNELQRASARSNGSVSAKRPSKNRGRRTDLAKWVFVKNLSSQASTPANLSVADRVGWAHAQAPNHVKRAAEQHV